MKAPWTSGFTERSAPGTVWCLYCPKPTPATCTVDDDYCCDNCAARQATLTGYERIPLKGHAAPIDLPPVIAEPIVEEVPIQPDKNRVETPTQEETPMPKIAKEVRDAIVAADPAVSNIALARKYEISDALVSYYRRAARKKPGESSAKTAKPAVPKPPVASPAPLPPPRIRQRDPSRGGVLHAQPERGDLRRDLEPAARHRQDRGDPLADTATEGGAMTPRDPEDLADLAFNIADEHCADLIESCTVDIVLDGEPWLTFGGGQRCNELREDCADEIDYLEARGLLRRHPTRPELVRIEEGWR